MATHASIGIQIRIVKPLRRVAADAAAATDFLDAEQVDLIV